MNITHYLNRHWTPDYDCWALVREFYLREFNIKLPAEQVDSDDIRACADSVKHSPTRDLFTPIDKPFDGCVVEMGQRFPFHVGIWVQGRVLHNFYIGGVVCEAKPRLDILAYYAYCNPLSNAA